MKKRKKIGCACQHSTIGKKRTMKKRRISGLNTKGIMNTVTNDLLPVAGGFVLANLLIDKFGDKLPFPARYLKLGAGIFLAGTQKGMLRGAGLGVAAAGAVEIVTDAISGVGLLPPGGRSYYIAGTDESETPDSMGSANPMGAGRQPIKDQVWL